MNTSFSSFTKKLGKVSVPNSVNNLTLASGESFTGNFEQVALYAEISVLVVLGTGESASLSLVSAIDRQGTNTLTRTVVVSESSQHLVLPVSAYFRIELNADQGTAATGAIQTIYHKNKSKPQTVSADNVITDNTDVEIVRAIMVGQDPVTGDYINISSINGSGTITANLASPLDGFGRLQVSNQIKLFSSKQQLTNDPEQIQTLITGTGIANYTPPFPHTSMQVLASGDRVVRQGRQYSSYQPGKSLNFLLTGTLLDDSANDNIRARIGPFDDINDKVLDTYPTGDGFFFELIGSTTTPVLNLVHRSSNTQTLPAPGSATQVDTPVAQSSWNIDPLDGTGLSGVTIDPTKRQVFAFFLEWLGTGDVICGIYINNVFTPCHRFQFANGITGIEDEVAYSTRGSLPVRYELEATGVPTATATMRQVCSAASSDGGFNPEGRIHAIGRGSVTNTPSTTEAPVLSLRLNQTGTTDIRPRVTLNILKADFIVTGSGDTIFNIYIFRNPTQFGAGPLTGASFVNSSGDATLNDSAAEYDISATAVDLTGVTYPVRRVEQGFFSKEASSIEAQLQERLVTLVSDIAGNSDLIVMTLQTFAGNQTASASIQWQEYE